MANHFIINDEQESIIEQVLALHQEFLKAAEEFKNGKA